MDRSKIRLISLLETNSPDSDSVVQVSSELFVVHTASLKDRLALLIELCENNATHEMCLLQLFCTHVLSAHIDYREDLSERPGSKMIRYMIYAERAGVILAVDYRRSPVRVNWKQYLALICDYIGFLTADLTGQDTEEVLRVKKLLDGLEDHETRHQIFARQLMWTWLKRSGPIVQNLINEVFKFERKAFKFKREASFAWLAFVKDGISIQSKLTAFSREEEHSPEKMSDHRFFLWLCKVNISEYEINEYIGMIMRRATQLLAPSEASCTAVDSILKKILNEIAHGQLKALRYKYKKRSSPKGNRVLQMRLTILKALISDKNTDPSARQTFVPALTKKAISAKDLDTIKASLLADGRCSDLLSVFNLIDQHGFNVYDKVNEDQLVSLFRLFGPFVLDWFFLGELGRVDELNKSLGRNLELVASSCIASAVAEALAVPKTLALQVVSIDDDRIFLRTIAAHAHALNIKLLMQSGQLLLILSRIQAIADHDPLIFAFAGHVSCLMKKRIHDFAKKIITELPKLRKAIKMQPDIQLLFCFFLQRPLMWRTVLQDIYQLSSSKWGRHRGGGMQSNDQLSELFRIAKKFNVGGRLNKHLQFFKKQAKQNRLCTLVRVD